MRKFWTWFLGLFGINVVSNLDEVTEDTTAHYDPEEFDQADVEAALDELEDDIDWEEEIVTEDEIVNREPSKFAVIIGINKYDPSLDADLNGCVNDVESMYEVLNDTYGFPHDNIRVLTDFRATQDNIYDRIEWLLNHNVPGDELVLHYSGHGSQVRDRNGDELDDYLDEILCPTDLDWDDPFTDDVIAELFKRKADGVFLTFICDSCHSGSMSRMLIPDIKVDIDKYTTPVDRFIAPPRDIAMREGDCPAINKMGKAIGDQNHVLLSGCRDNQTSADAYIDGKWQGALTSSLVKAIKQNPHRDWVAIHAEVISILNVGDYSQKPQLSGNADLIQNRNIFGVSTLF